MMRYLKKLPDIVRDYWLYIFAVIGEISALFVNFFLFALIQHKFGPEQLSLYMIIRRAISMILPAVMLGVPLSLVKHIGAITDTKLITRYIWIGLAIPLALTASLLLLGYAAPELLSRLFLGNKRYAEFVVPLLFLVLSTGMVLTVVSISKGLHRIALASALYIAFFAVSPMAAYGLSTSLPGFLAINGLILFIGAGVIVMLFIRSCGKFAPDISSDAVFITFGLKSAASDFLMMFMLWLPPFIIASSDAIKISGYFSLMMSLVLVAASPLAPIGSAMMPRIARALHNENTGELKKLYHKIAKLLFIIAIPAFVMILFLYDVVANYLLHGVPPMGNKVTMLMMTASIPISAYFGLRNMVDVGYSPTRNLYNIMLSFIVFLSCYFLVTNYNPLAIRIGVVLGFTFSVWVLGGLTAYYSYRLSHHRIV